VDIRRTLARDFYLAVTEVDRARELINLTVLIKPLINWIWIGSTLLVLGAGLVLAGLLANRHGASQIAGVQG